MSNIKRDTYSAIVFLFISLSLVYGGVLSWKDIFIKKEVKVVVDTVEEKINPFENLSLVADSVYVIDPETGNVLLEKNSERIRPIASITKVVSALVSSEILEPNQPVVIDKYALGEDDDNGLLLDETWSFRKLLDFSLLVSSNDGAYAIASIAGAVANPDSIEQNTATSSVKNFVDLMNDRVVSIGLFNTHFSNPNGLDIDEGTAGAYSNAKEIAELFEYILENNPDILEATRLEYDSLVSQNGLTHDAKNTNESYPAIAGLLASKTGYTDLANGNLAIAFDVGINHPIIAVVLGSGYKDRFDDINKIVKASNLYFAE